jgi:hypothetical protein
VRSLLTIAAAVTIMGCSESRVPAPGEAPSRKVEAAPTLCYDAEPIVVAAKRLRPKRAEERIVVRYEAPPIVIAEPRDVRLAQCSFALSEGT